MWLRPPASISSTTANRSSYNVRLNLTFAALVVTFLTTVKRPSHPKESSFRPSPRRPTADQPGRALALIRVLLVGGLAGKRWSFRPPTPEDRRSSCGRAVLAKPRAACIESGVRISLAAAAAAWLEMSEAPIARLGRPDELPAPVLWRAGSFIVGVALPVDGGYTTLITRTRVTPSVPIAWTCSVGAPRC